MDAFYILCFWERREGGEMLFVAGKYKANNSFLMFQNNEWICPKVW